MIGARGSESKAVISSWVVIAVLILKWRRVGPDKQGLSSFVWTYPSLIFFLQFFHNFEVLRGYPRPRGRKKGIKNE